MVEPKLLFIKSLVMFLLSAGVCLTSGDNDCPSPCKCSRNLQTINCRGKGLHSIPKPFPHAAVSIDLSQNQLSGTENGSFAMLPNLKTLDLSNNKITTIPIEAFVGCGNLTTLRLTANNLDKLHTSTFYKTPELENLDLSSNQLSVVPDLRNLERLQNLYLAHNKLTSFAFPDGYKTLGGLKRITLSNNKMVTSIKHSDFQSLSGARLTKLSVDRCNIGSVDKGSFSPFRQSLSSLRLSQNPINGDVLQAILADFANSKSLTSLELSSLSLTQTVKNTTFTVLGTNNRLASLNLAGNHLITQIENGAFTLLKYLTYLTISGTGLTEQPNLHENTRLIHLDMSSNAIRTVYPTRFPKESLTTLQLDGNRLTTIASPFKYLTKLTSLTLNGNTIGTFSKESFVGLESLRTFNLADNILSYLPNFVFDPLGQLTSLDLSNNNIKYINSTVFNKTQALTTLDVSGNNLNSVHPMLFAGLQNLVRVNLSKNKLGLGFHDNRLNYNGFISKLSRLQVVDMSSNAISTLPGKMISDTPLLNTLNLGTNNIYGWSAQHVFKGPVPLKKLWLNSNKLALFNASSLSTLLNLTDLDLTNNPFACNCDMRKFRDWLKTTKVHVNNSHIYMCMSPPYLVGTYLMDYDLSAIQCLPVWIKIVAGVAGGVVILLITGAICYRYRWKVRYAMYKCSKRCCLRRGSYQALRDEAAGYEYAAYLSHCFDETCGELVSDDILPRIDNDHRMFPHHVGDFPIIHRAVFDGARNIFDNLEDAFAKSACTVVIVCKHYKNNRRCEFELTQSLYLQQHNVGRRPVVVVLTPEGLPLKYIPTSLHPMVDSHEPNHIEWRRGEPGCAHQLNGELARVWSPSASAPALACPSPSAYASAQNKCTVVEFDD